MRRFETPPAPSGWTGPGATLIRIVDPLGGATAWLAPDYGGACVGYAIRRAGDDTAWAQVLRVGSPREWRDDPAGIGIAVVGPTADDAAAASAARWLLVERDPTAATCAARVGPVRLLLTARLDAASLHLDLRAEPAGETAQTVSLGLRLTFADEFRFIDEATTGLMLTSDDDNLRLTLATTGQESPHWQVVETEGNVGIEGIEIWGADSISLIMRHET